MDRGTATARATRARATVARATRGRVLAARARGILEDAPGQNPVRLPGFPPPVNLPSQAGLATVARAAVREAAVVRETAAGVRGTAEAMAAAADVGTAPLYGPAFSTPSGVPFLV